MEWIELGKLAEITSGQGAPQNSTIYSKEGTPFIRAGNLKELSASGNLNVCDKIKGEIGKSLGLKIYKKGTVVFAKSGMSCLKSYIYMLEEDSFVVNHLACLNIDRNHLIPKYLKYVLEYRKPKELINDRSYPSIRINDIRKFKIPVPAMEIQEKIVKILDQAQALIDKRKEQIEALDLLTESIFYNMFGDPVRNEKGWEVKRLKDITSKIGSGSTPRGGESSYKESGISLIRSMNVYDNKFKYDGLAYIDEEQAKLLSNVIVENNDILINITGASITRTTIVPKNILPARVNQHVSILRCNNQVTHIYLLHLLISKKYKEKIYYISTSSGATREALTKVNLENLEIPTPPISLQNKFADKVETIEKQKELLEQSLELLEENYKSIMDKAFKGQLFN